MAAKLRRFRTDEIAEILSIYKRLTQTEGRGIGESCEIIGQQFGRSKEVVYSLIRRFIPSVDGAEAYVKSQALRLAMRVVRKANVDQAINILERSNIGVLAPTAESQGQTGFFLSVKAENLGAVSIQAAMVTNGGAQVLPSTPSSGASGNDERYETRDEGAIQGFSEVIDIEPEPQMTDPGVPHPTQGTIKDREPNQDQLDAIANHRKRLTEARRQRVLARNREVQV